MVWVSSGMKHLSFQSTADRTELWVELWVELLYLPIPKD